MSEVFISYARANEAVAKRVESGLKAAGFDAWRDDQLPAHRSYSEIIEQRLRGASAVVVLWSKEASQSQWVRAEADFARTEGKLVQARLDDTLPPLPFNQIQCADLSGWRGHRKHKGWAKLVESLSFSSSGEQPKSAQAAAARSLRVDRRSILAAVAAILLLIAGAVLLLPRLTGEGDGRPTVAVLPFASLTAGDENLVDGIWEDTRQALSRNPQLTVIGRQSAQVMAREELDPRQYRSRFGVDYLLDGSIRHAGDSLRFSVNLVRTEDGAQVWSESFDRQLQDVFALQAEIAREIEGRIRGRLARGGGTMAEHISTTPEVYALYNDARAIVHKIDVPNMPTATKLLRRAIELDPNYAPAYATLALALRHTIPPAREIRPDQRHEPGRNARRAIALAPNLAIGHAALGYVLPPGPEAEAAIRRAVALDPNNAAILSWLARVEQGKGRTDAALKLYDRAAKIEPLSSDVVIRRLQLLMLLKHDAEVERELERLKQSGSIALNGLARMTVLESRRDLSEAARVGLNAYKAAPPEERGLLGLLLGGPLIQLQKHELAFRVAPLPPFALFMWSNDPRALPFIDKLPMAPADFWASAPMTQLICRNLVHHRRDRDLIRLYKEGAGSPEKLAERIEHANQFLLTAPYVAMALRRTGEAAEADALIALADQKLAERLNDPMDRGPGSLVRLARIRAVQGRHAEAAKALTDAVRGGWLSSPPIITPELLHDPPLALLKDLPEFQRARAYILNYVARERAELGPIDPEQVPMAPRPPGPPSGSG
ncbi:MAG TPA: TIR domain-containing protein [Sphingomicrobium sp.]|nr:TIR domain-containing protein [Sphingomicrobium sp.]